AGRAGDFAIARCDPRASCLATLSLDDRKTTPLTAIFSLSGAQIQFGQRNSCGRLLIKHPEGLSDDGVVEDGPSSPIAEHENSRNRGTLRLGGRRRNCQCLLSGGQGLPLPELLDLSRQPLHFI